VLLGLYWYILFAAVILSFVIAYTRPPEWLHPIIRFVRSLTEPVLRIFRPLIPPIRVGSVALDVSIVLVFIILGILRAAVCGGVAI
jgi:YggT family protein